MFDGPSTSAFTPYVQNPMAAQLLSFIADDNIAASMHTPTPTPSTLAQRLCIEVSKRKGASLDADAALS